MNPHLPTIEQCSDATAESLRGVLPEQALPLVQSAFQAGFRAALMSFQLIGTMDPIEGMARIKAYQDESDRLTKQNLARYVSRTH